MKHFTFFKTCLVMVCLLFGVGSAWGDTAKLTFTAACSGSGTDDQGNNWTVTSDANESTYSDAKGIHYGTSSKAVSYLKLKTSSISGTITEIVVEASGAADTKALLSVKVGGSTFGASQNVTANNASYSFTGSNNGTVEVALTQNSAKKALYVKKVVVTYTPMEQDTRTAVNITDFIAEQTALVKGKTTETTINNDQSGWTAAYKYESDNTEVATVDKNGVITAVSKGTTRITASLNVAADDPDYKVGTTASKYVDITVNNPSHIAKFSVNGVINEENDKTVEEGTTITFPTKPLDVNGKKFVGWTTSKSYFNAETAPSDLCRKAEMGENDIVYYAVFANVEEGSDITATVDAEGLEVATYKKGTRADDQNNMWAYYAAINNQSGTFCFSLNSNASNYNIGSPIFPGRVKSISLRTYNGSNSNSRKLLFCSSDEVAQPKSGDIAELSIPASQDFADNFDVDLTKASDFDQFFIYAAAALSISEIKVTYNESSYTDYTTNPLFTVTTFDDDFYSLYLDHAVTVPGNVTAYKGKLDGLTLKLEAIEGTIPANTGVLFKTEAAGEAKFVACADVAPLEDNDIKGVAVETEIAAIAQDKKVLVLGVVDGKVGFAQPAVGATTIAANKAYILVPASATAVRIFQNEETGIEQISQETTLEGKAYNLCGQRVSANAKGIVIVNGKKIFNK